MTKEGIAKSLHVYVRVNRARLTACEVGVFLREITPKNTLTPLFEELKFITQKHIFERLW